MKNVAWLGGVAVLIGLTFAAPGAADEPAVNWEYKAISFNVDPAEATKILNDMSKAGWDYVGPLGRDMVAFRRPLVTQTEITAKKENERLQGTWTTTATESNGTISRETRPEKWIISGQKWTVKLDGEVTQEGTYKVVETGDRFVKVDFLVTEGYKQGDTWIAIYQIDGDKLRMNGCYLSESKQRARTLGTKDGDGMYVRTMKKEK
jgi:uncharacterized protein (TIGR03067 family)